MTQNFAQIGHPMLALIVNATMLEKPNTESIAGLPNTGQRKGGEKRRGRHSIAHAKLERLRRLNSIHITVQVDIRISTESNQELYSRMIGLSLGIRYTVEKKNLGKQKENSKIGF